MNTYKFHFLFPTFFLESGIVHWIMVVKDLYKHLSIKFLKKNNKFSSYVIKLYSFGRVSR